MFQYVSSPGIICNNSIFENNAHAHKKRSKNLLLRNHDRIENYFTSLEQRMPLDFPYKIVKQYRFHLMVVLYANLYRSCLNLNKLNNLPDIQQQFYIVHCHMVEISQSAACKYYFSFYKHTTLFAELRCLSYNDVYNVIDITYTQRKNYN